MFARSRLLLNRLAVSKPNHRRPMSLTTQMSVPKNFLTSPLHHSCSLWKNPALNEFEFQLNTVKPCVQVTNQGETLEIRWTKGVSSKFLAPWLHYNDPVYQAPESNDRAYLSSLDLDLDLKIRNVVYNHEDSNVRVRFEDGKVSFFPLKMLWENSHECWLKTRQSQLEWMQDWRSENHSDSMPEIHQDMENVLKNDDALWEVISAVNKFGFCLIKSGSIEPSSVLKMAQRLGGVQQTNCDQVFDVQTRSQQYPTFAAYSSVFLEAHMDLCHFESQPGLQLLHCLANDSRNIIGGESTLVDSFAVADKLRASDPQSFDILRSTPVSMRRVNATHDFIRCRPLIQVSEVDKHSITGVRWYPFAETPLSTISDAEQHKKFLKAYKKFSEMLNSKQHSTHFRFEEGDLLVMNNRRVCHGRQAFEQVGQATRHLRGTYVLMDDFTSLFRTLRRGKIDNGEVNVPHLTICGDWTD